MVTVTFVNADGTESVIAEQGREGYEINACESTTGLDIVSSATISIPSTNKMKNVLRGRNPTIAIYENQTRVFIGSVASPVVEDVFGNVKVTLDGALSWLSDISKPPFKVEQSSQLSVAEYLSRIVQQFNSSVRADRQIKLGGVTVEGIVEVNHSDSYTKTIDLVREIREIFGGYLLEVCGGKGDLPRIDYVSELTVKNPNPLYFGENLKSLEDSVSYGNYASRICATGENGLSYTAINDDAEKVFGRVDYCLKSNAETLSALSTEADTLLDLLSNPIRTIKAEVVGGKASYLPGQLVDLKDRKTRLVYELAVQEVKKNHMSGVQSITVGREHVETFTASVNGAGAYGSSVVIRASANNAANYVDTLHPVKRSGESGIGNVAVLDNGVRLLYRDNSDTYFTLVLSETLKAGKTYTLSFNCTGADAADKPISYQLRSNGSVVVNELNLKDGRVAVTFTPSVDSSEYILFDDIQSQSTRPRSADVWLTEFQIEDGRTASTFRPSIYAVRNEVERVELLTNVVEGDDESWAWGLIDEKWVNAVRLKQVNTTWESLANGVSKSTLQYTKMPFPVRYPFMFGSASYHDMHIGNVTTYANGNGACIGAQFNVFADGGTPSANTNYYLRLLLSDMRVPPPTSPNQSISYDATIAGQIVDTALTYVTAQKNGRVFKYGPNFFYLHSDRINDSSGAGYMECDTFAGLVLRGVTYAQSPYADLTANKTQDYDAFMAATASNVPTWATRIRNLIADTKVLNLLGRDARSAGGHALAFWLKTGAIFSDMSQAKPGDVALFRNPQSDGIYFDAITHIAIVGGRDDTPEHNLVARDSENSLIISEVTGSAESGGRILQNVALRYRSGRPPAYFFRPYGWS